MALIASLPIVLIGQLLEFLVSGLFFILLAAHVDMRWSVAFCTEATFTSPTLDESIPLFIIRGHLYEGRAILERAVQPCRFGDSSLYLPTQKNLQVGWR